MYVTFGQIFQYKTVTQSLILYAYCDEQHSYVALEEKKKAEMEKGLCGFGEWLKMRGNQPPRLEGQGVPRSTSYFIL